MMVLRARRLRIPFLFWVLSFAFLPPALWPQEQTTQRPQIIIAGAQSLVPLAEKFSAHFQKKHPQVQIEIRGGGSNYAVNAVRNGEVHVGLIARRLTAAEGSVLRAEPFGQDAIILLTYPGNSVTNLTLHQIRNIYLGRVENWKDVGGQEKGIVPLTRERNSAIHAIFLECLFGRDLPGEEKAFTIRASKEKVLRTIKRIEGSLGYGIVRLEEAKQQGVKVLAVDGSFPTSNNIQAGLYHFVRPQLLIVRGTPTGIVKEWTAGLATFVQRPTVLGSWR